MAINRDHRNILIGLILLGFALGVPLYLFLSERERQLAVGDAPQPTLEAESIEMEARSTGERSVQLYFYRPGGMQPDFDFLRTEERKIFETEEVNLTARQIVAEVLKGPENGKDGLFSPEARIRQFYLLEDGTAVLDVSREVSHELGWGVLTELAAIHSLTRSLVDNVKEIERVRFLVDGREDGTFAGHVSIREPFM